MKEFSVAIKESMEYYDMLDISAPDKSSFIKINVEYEKGKRFCVFILVAIMVLAIHFLIMMNF